MTGPEDQENTQPRRRQTHAVVTAPSQWGQQACEHLIHRTAHGGLVTLIVPRRDEHAFRSATPVIDAWSSYESLAECIDELRRKNTPIQVVFDDQLDALKAELVKQRTMEDRFVLVYVTSGAEDHLAQCVDLQYFANMTVVEKPVTRFLDELVSDELVSEQVVVPQDPSLPAYGRVVTTEHFLFRPGITAAINEQNETRNLVHFLQKATDKKISYEFHFEEAASREDPNLRLGAFQDGSILDVAVTHGLGPIVSILLPALGVELNGLDLFERLDWTKVDRWQAVDVNGDLKVSTLSETAAELHGTLKVDSTIVDVHLKAAKGCQKYLRYLKFSYVEDYKEYFYGVSLGSAGYTVSTPDFYGDFEGGWESDKAGGKPGSANAQASLLNVALEGGETIKAGNSTIERFYPLKTGCEIVRLGLMAQGLASRHDFKSYSWGSSPFAAKTNPWKVSTEQIATHRAAWCCFLH